MDTIIRTATTPAEAVKSLNLCTDGWSDAFSPDYKDYQAFPDEKNEGFGVTRFKVDKRDQKEIAVKLSEFDLVRLKDSFEEFDKSEAIDINRLIGKVSPLPRRTDLPGPIERQEAGKIMRMLMLGMRSLWYPVKQPSMPNVCPESAKPTRARD